jgi:hypothetical protein
VRFLCGIGRFYKTTGNAQLDSANPHISRKPAPISRTRT